MAERRWRVMSVTPAGSPKSWMTDPRTGRQVPDPSAGLTEWPSAVIETDLDIGRSLGGGSFREVYIGDELPEGSITDLSESGIRLIPPVEGPEFVVGIGAGETSVGRRSKIPPQSTYINDVLRAQIERAGIAFSTINDMAVEARLKDTFVMPSVMESDIGREFREQAFAEGMLPRIGSFVPDTPEEVAFEREHGVRPGDVDEEDPLYGEADAITQRALNDVQPDDIRYPEAYQRLDSSFFSPDSLNDVYDYSDLDGRDVDSSVLIDGMGLGSQR